MLDFTESPAFYSLVILCFRLALQFGFSIFKTDICLCMLYIHEYTGENVTITDALFRVVVKEQGFQLIDRWPWRKIKCLPVADSCRRWWVFRSQWHSGGVGAKCCQQWQRISVWLCKYWIWQTFSYLRAVRLSLEKVNNLEDLWCWRCRLNAAALPCT